MYKILVLGAGAVGTYFGAKLYAVHHDVQLYGRRKLQQLDNTVKINNTLYPLPPKVSALQPDFYHLILVTTKLIDTPGMIDRMQEMELQAQVVAFIQNGIVAPKFYGDLYHHPDFITLSLFNGYRLCHQQLTVLETNLGVQVPASSVGQKICDLLNDAGINCQMTDQIERMQAEKLILNATLNALSGLEQKTMGELVDDAKLQPVLNALVREGWAVLRSDYDLPTPGVLAANIYQAARQVSDHYSSLHQDLMSGRPTEVEFLNGLIVQLGRQQGIPTPYNEQIYQRVLAMEASSSQEAIA